MKRYAFYDFKFGVLKIGYTDRAITDLKTTQQMDDVNQPSVLSHRAFHQICEYLNGQRRSFDFPYEFHGTEFQQKVWDALCRIPYGETRTYKQIAIVAGNPKASRAVGRANNQNPITLVVPCHRVIGTNGALTGYAGGMEMKKALLELEQNNRE